MVEQIQPWKLREIAKEQRAAAKIIHDKKTSTKVKKAFKVGGKKAKKIGKKALSSISKTKFAKKRALRKVLKKTNITVEMKDPDVESILMDRNRYFKNKYEEDKRSLFFS